MISRKVGDTISVRTTVKENGTIKVITGGTAKARLQGRPSGPTLDATIPLTELARTFDAAFAATSLVDAYALGCRLTLTHDLQTVPAAAGNPLPSVYRSDFVTP